jgi:cytochrome c-type biogenesis protein CcmE
MKPKHMKIAVTAAVLALALGGLFYSTLQDGTEYYVHVDEVMNDPGSWHGKRLQLHGFVVDKSIFVKPQTLEYRFQIQNKGSVVPASYTGIVPDTFKDGSEVVLKGHLEPGGFTVEPNGVMAKCPSKYVAGQPGAPGS